MAFRCLTSLPNIKGDGHIRECFVENDEAGEAQAQEFIKHEDVPGRAVYECIGLVGERRRGKDMGAIETTCAEAPSKAKPNLRVVEFKKMEPAHV
jgi:hypothetical protein